MKKICNELIRTPKKGGGGKEKMYLIIVCMVTITMTISVPLDLKMTIQQQQQQQQRPTESIACYDRDCFLKRMGCGKLSLLDGRRDLELPISDSKCSSALDSSTLQPTCRTSTNSENDNTNAIKYFKSRFPLGNWVPIERYANKNGTRMERAGGSTYFSFYQECDENPIPKDKFPLEDQREEDGGESAKCHVALKPGCSLELVETAMTGHFVARWLQGTLKDGKRMGSSTSNFYVTSDDGKREFYRSSRTTQTTSSAHKYSPEWTEVIQHFEIKNVNVEQDDTLSFGLENANFGKSNLFLKGVEFYACPSSYWNGYFGLDSSSSSSLTVKEIGDSRGCDTFNVILLHFLLLSGSR